MPKKATHAVYHFLHSPRVKLFHFHMQDGDDDLSNTNKTISWGFSPKSAQLDTFAFPKEYFTHLGLDS